MELVFGCERMVSVTDCDGLGVSVMALMSVLSLILMVGCVGTKKLNFLQLGLLQLYQPLHQLAIPTIL